MRSKRTVSVPQENIDQMISILSHKGWVSTKYIVQKTGFSIRLVRACASQSDGQIISGHHGYRLNDMFASEEEVSHCINNLESKARDMLARAEEIKETRRSLLYMTL